MPLPACMLPLPACLLPLPSCLPALPSCLSRLVRCAQGGRHPSVEIQACATFKRKQPVVAAATAPPAATDGGQKQTPHNNPCPPRNSLEKNPHRPRNTVGKNPSSSVQRCHEDEPQRHKHDNHRHQNLAAKSAGLDNTTSDKDETQRAQAVRPIGSPHPTLQRRKMVRVIFFSFPLV